jgi:hypothetical protein
MPPSKPFPIHHSLITLSFGVLVAENVSLNKLQIERNKNTTCDLVAGYSIKILACSFLNKKQ